jgi:hypothetical protein
MVKSGQDHAGDASDQLKPMVHFDTGVFVGRAFLMEEDDDGRRCHAHIIEVLDDLALKKFKCLVGVNESEKVADGFEIPPGLSYHASAPIDNGVIDDDDDDGIDVIPSKPCLSASIVLDLNDNNNYKDEDGIKETPSKPPGLGSTLREPRLSASIVINLDNKDGIDATPSKHPGLGHHLHALADNGVIDHDNRDGIDVIPCESCLSALIVINLDDNNNGGGDNDNNNGDGIDEISSKWSLLNSARLRASLVSQL